MSYDSNVNDAGQTYYIRIRGRVLGPFDVERLKLMRDRGLFGRAHEVSTDRQTWKPAASIEKQLVGSTSSRQSQEEDDAFNDLLSDAPPSPSVKPPPLAGGKWYYSLGGEQFGPVNLVEVRGLVQTGQLTASDLVWKEGTPDWRTVDEVEELRAAPRSMTSLADSGSGRSAGQMSAFCRACGSGIDMRAEVCPNCGVRQHASPASGTGAGRNGRSRVATALLAFFLGGLGAHHFYLGNILLGLIYLLFCWTFLPALIAFVEFIVFLCMSDETFNAKYNR